MTVSLAYALARLQAANLDAHAITLAAKKAAGREPNDDQIGAQAAWGDRYSDALTALGYPQAERAVFAIEVEVVRHYADAISLTPAQAERAAPLYAAAIAGRGEARSRILAAAEKIAGWPAGRSAPDKPVGPLPFDEDEIARLTPARVEPEAPPVSARIRAFATDYIDNTERIRAKHHGF